MRGSILAFAVLAAILTEGATASAETGYDLWLRYPAVEDPGQRDAYRRAAAAVVMPPGSETGEIIAAELTRGLSGLLGVAVPRVERFRSAGAVIAGTPKTSPQVAALG